MLQTTPKARRDLYPGVQTLALRERSLLLLANAAKPAGELRLLFNGMGEQILADMLRQGYLAEQPENDLR